MTKFSLGKPPYKKPLLACKSVIRSSGPGVGGGGGWGGTQGSLGRAEPPRPSNCSFR